MTSNDQLDLDAIQTRLDALNALGIPGATWKASPRDEKSVIPPEMAHVVEDVLKTGGALLRSSVGVFGDEAHAEFVAHARKDVAALLDEVRRLRAELATSERIRENADFHLGQEMARRQLAGRRVDNAVAALQEKAQELSAEAEQEMRRDLEEQAQVWHEAADMVRRVARKEARSLAAEDAAAPAARSAAV